MRHPRSIGHLGLAFLTALLLSGIAAASASAASFEATPSFPVKFTGKGGAGFLETKAGRSVTCQETEATGEVSGPAEVKNVFVHFKGCFAEHLAVLHCGTSAAVSGEISTNAIKARPVDLNAAHTEAGLLLEPEVAAGLFAEFKCEAEAPLVGTPVKETLKVKGSIIGKVPTAELNEFRETLNLEFKETKGAPEPSQVEGAGERHVLLTEGAGTEPFAFEESGIQELVPGETKTTALESKKIKLVP